MRAAAEATAAARCAMRAAAEATAAARCTVRTAVGTCVDTVVCNAAETTAATCTTVNRGAGGAGTIVAAAIPAFDVIVIITSDVSIASSDIVVILASDVFIASFDIVVIPASDVFIASSDIVVVSMSDVIIASSDIVVVSASVVVVAVTNVIAGPMIAAASAVVNAAVMIHGITICSAESSIPVRTTMFVEATVMIDATVSAVIAVINRRKTIVKIACAVVTIDGKEPSVMKPSQRTEEVVSGGEDSVLPVVENMTNVSIAISEIVAIDLVCRLDAQQVVEVDFIAVVVLLIIQVELIGHLIREETGLFACLFVAHGREREDGADAQHQGEHVLFHIAFSVRD